MKIFMLMLLWLMAGTVGAQDADYAFAMHPNITQEDLSASRFWTRSTIALVALDGVAKAADGFATHTNIQDGGSEFDPLARPFVHSTTVQIVATGALFGGEIAAAYLLHKKHHDRMARVLLIGGATMNGIGAATSFKHRTAGR